MERGIEDQNEDEGMEYWLLWISDIDADFHLTKIIMGTFFLRIISITEKDGLEGTDWITVMDLLFIVTRKMTINTINETFLWSKGRFIETSLASSLSSSRTTFWCWSRNLKMRYSISTVLYRTHSISLALDGNLQSTSFVHIRIYWSLETSESTIRKHMKITTMISYQMTDYCIIEEEKIDRYRTPSKCLPFSLSLRGFISNRMQMRWERTTPLSFPDFFYAVQTSHWSLSFPFHPNHPPLHPPLPSTPFRSYFFSLVLWDRRSALQLIEENDLLRLESNSSLERIDNSQSAYDVPFRWEHDGKNREVLEIVMDDTIDEGRRRSRRRVTIEEIEKKEGMEDWEKIEGRRSFKSSPPTFLNEHLEWNRVGNGG